MYLSAGDRPPTTTEGKHTMSSFVCSDHTILAIVEGMRKYGMVAKKKAESRDMAEALRFINEYQTTKRYMKHGEARKWAIEVDHREVRATPRRYSDGEVLAAIECYLYQIDTAPLHDLDFITLIASVKLLKEKVIEAGKAAGGLKEVTEYGAVSIYELCEDDEWHEVTELHGWDLAA